MRGTGAGLGAKLTLTLVGGALLGSLIGACGSGGAAGSGTAAEQPKQALSAKTTGGTPAASANTSAAKPDPTTTETTVTATVTEPSVTKTKTQPGPTTTKIETTPGQTSQTTTSKSLVVTPASTTGGGSGNEVPWWGWLLIALGAVGVGVGIFSLGRHSGSNATGLQAPHQPVERPPPPGPPGAQM